jgi:beta-lactamase class A
MLLLSAFGYRLYQQRSDISMDTEPVEQIVVQEVSPQVEPEPKVVPLASVQSELDAWLESAVSPTATYSVLLSDPLAEDVLAEHNADETFFAASIYKLYVAYLGLMDIDANLENPNEQYNQGRTREQCITEMIRDSDSPCAEQMWVEQGKQESTTRLNDLFGFTGTSMEAVTTTARDASTIMSRLQREVDLSTESTQLLRQALQDQIYDQAIPAGAPRAEVYNKVGFYETGWLDTAIIKLPSGREVILTIYADGAGSRQIASLTQAIITPLLAEGG